MKKLILITTIPLCLIGGIFLYQKQTSPSQPQPTIQPEVQTSTVDVNIVFPDNTVSKTLDISEDDTAYSVLEKVTKENNLPLDIKEYDFGIFVQSIGDYESSADMSWIYFVDGQSGNVAADQYELKPGQTVEWKYVKPNYEE